MSRIRTIKPEFWVSEQISNCSRDSRLLFIGLWNFSDDNGIHPASILKLKNEIFPADNISLKEMQKLIDELVKNNLLIAYTIENKMYWKVTGWNAHQVIHKPTFKYPEPSIEALNKDNSYNFRGNPRKSAKVVCGMEGNGMEGNGVIYNSYQDIITSGAEPKNEMFQNCEIEDVLITFVLNDKSEYPITQTKVDEWQSLFPAVDIMEQLRKAKSWCIDNPTRRKTKRGILSFINRWLCKEQDNGAKVINLNQGKYYAKRERRIESIAEKVERQQREDRGEQSAQYL